jgi:sialic acid synthase SpsE
LPALALAFGITTIEKHITTNRQEKLEDYEAALGLNQFVNFVDFVRAAEEALGFGDIDYLTNDSYKKYRDVGRKKIVASRDLFKGSIVLESDLLFKRADYGEQIENMDKVIGRKLLKDVKKNKGLERKNLL